MEETASVENEVVHSNFAPETGESTPPKTTDRQASNKVVQPPEATELAESDSMLNQNGSGFKFDLENGSPIEIRRVNRGRSSVKWQLLVSAPSMIMALIALAISIFVLANTTKQQTSTKETTMGEPGRFNIDLSRQRFCSKSLTLQEMPCQLGGQLITGLNKPLPLNLKKNVDDFMVKHEKSSIFILRPGLYSLNLKVHFKMKVQSQLVTIITIDEKMERICLSQSSHNYAILDCTLNTQFRLHYGSEVQVKIVNADATVLAESHISFLILHRLRE